MKAKLKKKEETDNLYGKSANSRKEKRAAKKITKQYYQGLSDSIEPSKKKKKKKTDWNESFKK
jgi:hypothetical protein